MSPTGTGWREALAVAGVLIPMIMSVNAVRLGLWYAPSGGWGLWPWNAPSGFSISRVHPDWSAWALWPVIAVLALFGVRRAASVAAIAAITWWTAIVGEDYARHNATAAVVAVWWPLLGLIGVAGLIVRPGPGRG